MEFVPTDSGNEDMPIWTRKAIVTIWEVLEDVEAGKRVREEHFGDEKRLLEARQDFFWWVTTSHGEKNQKTQHEWVVVLSMRIATDSQIGAIRAACSHCRLDSQPVTCW